MTYNNYCTVCGLPEKACLHSQNYDEQKKDYRVTALFWAIIGFILGVGLSLTLYVELCEIYF